MALDRKKSEYFIKKHEKIGNNQLIEAGYLINNYPEKGDWINCRKTQG